MVPRYPAARIVAFVLFAFGLVLAIVNLADPGTIDAQWMWVFGFGGLTALSLS